MFLEKIDQLLNNYTMYRVVLYGLGVIAANAVVFAFLGLLPFSGVDALMLLALVLLSSYVAHEFAAKLFKAITNTESFLITALILFLILAPVTSATDIVVTLAVTTFAVLSKYLLAVRKKHVFNPAAVALVVMGVLGFGNAIWWVGSAALLPMVAVVGFLIVRKIRRFYLVWPYGLIALGTTLAFNMSGGMTPLDSVRQVVLSWPLVFFGTVMLTEPLTSPGRKREGVVYSGLVGFLFGARYSFGPIYSTPELALVLGNVLAYVVSSKENLMLSLQSSRKIGGSLYEFVFQPRGNFSFLPGQYLEWTLPVPDGDDRGNRRFFTIASSPTEKNVSIAVKITDQASRFKQELAQLKKGDQITATHLAGDFVLPSDPKQKLVFIAGGIGVTPFRSMIKYLVDTQQQRDAVLFYTASHPDELAYQSLFDQAKEVGVTAVYIITRSKNVPKNWSGEIGYLSREMLEKYVPDYAQRLFYISGPNRMVDSCCSVLGEVELPEKQIMRDYFPGF